MAVIGTAGHVDHGKSTLLHAITGRDPDRWEEEKRRGLTIDLGFAWTTLATGTEVSFVDVPGHERFIKNMLAGIEAIDVVLFVVAADEGWMPQSEEHLAVLDVLGIERGVVALTKVDRVERDLVELATLEIIERLEGTGLEGSEVIEVSAPSGLGVDRVMGALESLLPPEPRGDDPRLWIDRRFTIEGAGTIVTGTLLGGPVNVGDRLASHPGGETVRIRSIESHEKACERVDPGRRVALNIVGAPDDVGRGHMLGSVGRWVGSRRFTASITPARYVEEISARGAYHLHLGSVATPVRLRPLEVGYVVTAGRDLPIRYGDRFVVRESGRRRVVGGGVVLDPAPPRRGEGMAASAGLATGLPPGEAAATLLDLRGSSPVDTLVAHTGAPPRADSMVGGMAVTVAFRRRLADAAREEVRRFHDEWPLRPGLPVATLASRLGQPQEVIEAVLAGVDDLTETDGLVRSRDHTVALTDAQEKAWEQAVAMLREGGLAAPKPDDLPLEPELVHRMVREGRLVRISDDLVYLPEDARRLRDTVAAMPDEFSVADFRDAMALSRKYAVPILEWADAEGLTRRRGDVRSPVRR